jgi:hypothetical protein
LTRLPARLDSFAEERNIKQQIRLNTLKTQSTIRNNCSPKKLYIAGIKTVVSQLNR